MNTKSKKAKEENNQNSSFKSGKTEIKQVEQSFLNKYSDLVC